MAEDKGPGRLTLEELKQKTSTLIPVDSDGDGVIDQDEVKIAWLDTVKEIMTGPNGKWIIAGTVVIIALPVAVLGIWLTGYEFQLTWHGVVFTAPEARWR